MEENKSKAIKFPKKEDLKPLEQPTYEQMKYWLDKAINDNKALVEQLGEVTNVLNFLPYLFKVVKYKDNFEPTFVNNCIESITKILTPKKVVNTDNNETKGE